MTGKIATNKSPEISTDNLGLAAYLVIKQIPLLRVERSGRLGFFYFPEAQIKDHIQAYMAKGGIVEPQNFMDTIRALRARVDISASR